MTEKFSDPNLDPQEEDKIIGAFVRRQAREKLRERWAGVLEKDFGVQRTPSKKKGVVLFDRTTKIRRVILGVVAAAAVALILIFAVPRLTAPNLNTLTAELMLEPPVSSFRSGAVVTTIDSLRDLAASLVAGKNFGEAVKTMRLATVESEVTSPDRLYHGYVELNAGNESAAAQIFREIMNNDPLYRTHATFYLALSLLRSGNDGEGKELLRSIRKEDGKKFFDKAARLLKAR